MNKTICILAVYLPLTACLTLDPLLPFHSNIPCADVDETTCEGEADIWDRVCTPCEQPFEWDRATPWREKTLDVVDTIRGIPPSIVQEVPIDVGDTAVDLDAYFIPSHEEVPELASTTIIYNHGRYAGIDHYLPRVQLFYDLGYNVFVWDYRGYSKSLPAEAPASVDWMSDALAAYDAAVPYFPDSDKVIIYAMSVGGFPGGEMMAKRDACAQFFESAVISIKEKVEDNLSISLTGSLLTSGVLETDLKLADTTRPTLIMHGTADDRISLRSAYSFYDGLPDDIRKQIVEFEGAGHGLGGDGGVPDAGYGKYRDTMLNFLRENAAECLSE
jgi:pimeloyl-ACP methyl ester carboxylesterase